MPRPVRLMTVDDQNVKVDGEFPFAAMMFKGKIVAVVFSGAPIEDAICDEIIVPHADYEKIADSIARLGRKRFVR